jgi:phage tail protein X
MHIRYVILLSDVIIILVTLRVIALILVTLEGVVGDIIDANDGLHTYIHTVPHAIH